MSFLSLLGAKVPRSELHYMALGSENMWEQFQLPSETKYSWLRGKCSKEVFSPIIGKTRMAKYDAC